MLVRCRFQIVLSFHPHRRIDQNADQLEELVNALFCDFLQKFFG